MSVNRCKHIDIAYHFVRDRVERGKLLMEHISTAEMVADILTKTLPSPALEMCCLGMGLGPSSSLVDSPRGSVGSGGHAPSDGKGRHPPGEAVSLPCGEAGGRRARPTVEAVSMGHATCGTGDGFRIGQFFHKDNFGRWDLCRNMAAGPEMEFGNGRDRSAVCVARRGEWPGTGA